MPYMFCSKRCIIRVRIWVRLKSYEHPISHSIQIRKLLDFCQLDRRPSPLLSSTTSSTLSSTLSCPPFPFLSFLFRLHSLLKNSEPLIPTLRHILYPNITITHITMSQFKKIRLGHAVPQQHKKRGDGMYH